MAGITHGSTALDPLKGPVFRSLFTAMVICNTGLFIQDLGAAWLMTSLTREPIMTALMQTAVNLPFFLMALPCGALADVIDRRKILIIAHLWIMMSAATLGLVTLSGLTTPWVLLGLTFLLFTGSGFGSPAWSATTPDIVPRKHLESAIALGSAGYNMARGIGAALGGVIVAACGSGWAFIINACGYTFMLRALYTWRPEAVKTSRPREPFLAAMKAGIAYVKQSQALRAILVRTVAFSTAVSALWALVPLHARTHLHVTSVEYGIMVAAFGMGTFVGALIMPRMRQRLTLDLLSATGTILFALSLALIAVSTHFALAATGMLGCGIAWTIKNAALNVAVQFSAPNWVRARAYSIYLLVFQGCTASGALLWGAIATWYGLPVSMLCAAVALVVGLALSYCHKLAHAEDINQAETARLELPELSGIKPGN